MKGVYDTGSVELVVVSDKCSKWCGKLSALFHSKHSNSYQAGPQSVVLQYGSGEVLAHEAYDTISVGPLGSSAAPFWEVIDANMPLLQSAGFTSIVGLGPIAYGTEVMQHNVKAKSGTAYALLLRKLGVDRFSVCLGRPAKSPGFLTWNDGVLESMPRAFARVSTVQSGFWMTTLTDVRLGSTPVACSKVGDCGAVLDSGTSLISTPSEARETMLDLIEKLAVDCDNLAELPELHFKLDGVDHSLPPDSYIGRVRGSSAQGVQEYFRSPTDGTTCQATIMSMSMSSVAGQVWVLGMPFFRRYYSVFAQPTADSPPVMHTAIADADCRPVQGISQALQRNVHGPRAAVVARTVDASQVRMPSWLRAAARAGYLDSPSRNRARASNESMLDVHAQAL